MTGRTKRHPKRIALRSCISPIKVQSDGETSILIAFLVFEIYTTHIVQPLPGTLVSQDSAKRTMIWLGKARPKCSYTFAIGLTEYYNKVDGCGVLGERIARKWSLELRLQLKDRGV